MDVTFALLPYVSQTFVSVQLFVKKALQKVHAFIDAWHLRAPGATASRVILVSAVTQFPQHYNTFQDSSLPGQSSFISEPTNSAHAGIPYLQGYNDKDSSLVQTCCTIQGVYMSMDLCLHVLHVDDLHNMPILAFAESFAFAVLSYGTWVQISYSLISKHLPFELLVSTSSLNLILAYGASVLLASIDRGIVAIYVLLDYIHGFITKGQEPMSTLELLSQFWNVAACRFWASVLISLSVTACHWRNDSLAKIQGLVGPAFLVGWVTRSASAATFVENNHFPWLSQDYYLFRDFYWDSSNFWYICIDRTSLFVTLRGFTRLLFFHKGQFYILIVFKTDTWNSVIATGIFKFLKFQSVAINSSTYLLANYGDLALQIIVLGNSTFWWIILLGAYADVHRVTPSSATVKFVYTFLTTAFSSFSDNYRLQPPLVIPCIVVPQKVYRSAPTQWALGIHRSVPLFAACQASEAMHGGWNSLRILLLLGGVELDIWQLSYTVVGKRWSSLQSVELSKALMALRFFRVAANNFSIALLQIIPYPMGAVQACVYSVRAVTCSIMVTLNCIQVTKPILLAVLLKLQLVLLVSSARPPSTSILSLHLTCTVLNAKFLQVPVSHFGSESVLSQSVCLVGATPLQRNDCIHSWLVGTDWAPQPYADGTYTILAPRLWPQAIYGLVSSLGCHTLGSLDLHAKNNTYTIVVVLHSIISKHPCTHFEMHLWLCLPRAGTIFSTLSLHMPQHGALGWVNMCSQSRIAVSIALGVRLVFPLPLSLDLSISFEPRISIWRLLLCFRWMHLCKACNPLSHAMSCYGIFSVSSIVCRHESYAKEQFLGMPLKLYLGNMCALQAAISVVVQCATTTGFLLCTKHWLDSAVFRFKGMTLQFSPVSTL